MPRERPTSPLLEANRILGPGYELGAKIGEGSSGAIHLGRDIRSGEEVAVKLVADPSNKQTLMAEANFYKEHGGVAKGIPSMRWWGRPDRGVWALVVQRLWISLRQVKESQYGAGRMPPSAFVPLALQMLERVESLHARKIIHRDLKPENFMLGVGSERNTVYLIDYGMACTYTTSKHVHAAPRIDCPFSGTPDFASLNVSFGHAASRRDDLESLCYVYIFFLRGSLPWQNKRASSQEELIAAVARHKRRVSATVLCAGMPPAMLQFLVYVRTLGFKEAPDYKVCIWWLCCSFLFCRDLLCSFAHTHTHAYSTQYLADLLRSMLPPDFDDRQPLSTALFPKGETSGDPASESLPSGGSSLTVRSPQRRQAAKL